MWKIKEMMWSYFEETVYRRTARCRINTCDKKCVEIVEMTDGSTENERNLGIRQQIALPCCNIFVRITVV